MNMKPSPLRHLDLSDDKVAADMVAEKARELTSAYERIEHLQDTLRGLIHLIHLIADRAETMRDILKTDQNVADATDMLQ